MRQKRKKKGVPVGLIGDSTNLAVQEKAVEKEEKKGRVVKKT